MLLTQELQSQIKVKINDISEKGSKESKAFYFKMMRLKSDLQRFKEDVEYVLGGGKIIYASDNTEIKAYINPSKDIKDYLYDIEEVLTQQEIKQKQIKRWYRMRELFFNKNTETLVLPSHMFELDDDLTFYAQVMVETHFELVNIINDILIRKDRKYEYESVKDAIKKIDDIDKISKSKSDELGAFFKDYSVNVAALTYNKKYNFEEQALLIQRLLTLIREGNIRDLDSYNWIDYANCNESVADYICNLSLSKYSEKINEVADLLQYVRGKRLESNTRDAQALIYVDLINKTLKRNDKNVRVQLVTSTLAVYTLSGLLPEEYLNAYVRHPKFLPGLMRHFNQKQIIAILRGEFDYIISAVEAFIEKYNSSTIQENEKLVNNLKKEISYVWQKIENTIFLRETCENESISISEMSLKENLSPNTERGKIVDLMRFISDNKNAFNLYVNSSYKQIFLELIDFYLVKMIKMNKYMAVYLDSGKDISCYRMFLQSEGIRSVVEFNDSELIKKLIGYKEHNIGFGVFAKDIVEGRLKINSEYEVNLIKALFLATEKRWNLVCVMCNYSLQLIKDDEKAKEGRYEAYYLLSIAQRLLAFDILNDNRDKALQYYRSAKSNIKKARKCRNGNDYRFTLADAAITLESIYFSDNTIMKYESIKDNVEKLTSAIHEIQNKPRTEYYEYLEFRSYQLLISFYFMWYIHKESYGDQYSISEKSLTEWYDALMKYDTKSLQYKNFAKSVQIIELSVPLIKNLRTMKKDEVVDCFEEVYKKCELMREEGYYRRLIHLVKKEILTEIRAIHLVEDSVIKEKWSHLCNDLGISIV